METYNVRNTQSDFQYTEGTPLPLGVTAAEERGETGRAMNFSVAVLDTEECRLNIYRKGTDELVKSILLGSEFRHGSIYSVQMLSFNYEKYEYLYETDGVEFVDPYARIVTGRSNFGDPKREVKIKGGFYFEDFDWQGDKPLRIPYHELLLYRLHVRGFTKHISSKVKNRGTFAGVIEKIPYLKELGINAVEIMTFHEFDEMIDLTAPDYSYANRFVDFNKNRSITQPLSKKSTESGEKEENYRINYWGYSENGNYFAPKAAYASDTEHAGEELKNMIKELHRNGIEVIMEFYFPPAVTQKLILDALHYWVLEYHIDGFKLNTEIVSAEVVGKDPLLSHTKLFGNAWNTDDIYGARMPSFKNLAEYNEGFLMDMRRFLKSDEEQTGKVAFRIKRNPFKHGVINYITNTNGFTLMDLVSYDIKHNEANGESNQDGTDYNYSWNCGIEGKTRRKKILELRKKQIKNALVELLFSQGTPLILSGDEFGNSQGGNNNAYCQDNAICWLNWNQSVYHDDILEFVKKCIAIRKMHPILHMDTELKGMDYISSGFPDISFHGTKAWYPDYSNYSRVLGVFFNGRYALPDRIHADDDFYIAFNMHWEPHEFDLPKLSDGRKWCVLINTSQEQGSSGTQKVRVNHCEELSNQKQFMVQPRSILVFIGKMLHEKELKKNQSVNRKKANGISESELENKNAVTSDGLKKKSRNKAD